MELFDCTYRYYLGFSIGSIVAVLTFVVFINFKNCLLSIPLCLLLIGVGIASSYFLSSFLVDLGAYTLGIAAIIGGFLNSIPLILGGCMLLQHLAIQFVTPAIASVLVVLDYIFISSIIIKQYFDEN